MILGDLTRANPGTLAATLQRLSLTADRLKRDLVIAILPAQKVEIEDWVCRDVLEIDTASTDVPEAVFSVISKHLSVVADRPVQVFSYNPYVLRLFERFNAEQRSNLSLKHWARAAEIDGQTGVIKARPDVSRFEAWKIDSIGESEAVEVLVRALKDAKAIDSASGVAKTNIRPLVSALDARLGTEATGGVTGVVSSLIAAAKRRNLIEIDSNPEFPSSARIYLKELKAAMSKAIVPSSVEERERDKYQQTLREKGMGAFPNFREDVYLQMQSLLGDQDRPSAGNIVRRAVERVGERYSAEHKNFSFNSLQSFVTTLLKGVPVLKAEDDSLLTPSFQHMTKKVFGFVDGWMEKLDGQIILCLLQNACAISVFDVPALAGAMYRNREGENQEKVLRVIGILRDEGRITYGEDDSLQLAK